jgi:hypothetical protein
VREDFAAIVRRLDTPKSNAELQQAIDAVRVIAREVFDDALEVLRDPSWDRPIDLVGRWGHLPLKEQVWNALLIGSSAADVDRLWFLADHPDVFMRSRFISDALATGQPELLDRARDLFGNEEKRVREYTAIGIRDAMRGERSEAYIHEAATMLLEYVRAFPKDSDVARLMALRRADPDLALEAERVLAKVHRPNPNADWYILRGNDLGWGDYGHILVHGMANHLGRSQEGLPQLERTGPFIPPITTPGLDVLVVTAGARRELEGSGLRGLGYGPVVLAQVTKLDWQEWDLAAAEPTMYPAGGEPENYILGREHSPATAEALPDLFEVQLSVHPRSEDPPGEVDLVRSGRYRILASNRAKQWIEARWGQWVVFGNVDD